LVDRMRDAGIRVTSPRRAIVRVLEEAGDHLDVEEITERAKAVDPSVHRATVYRTLGLLKGLGLVDELDLLHLEGDRHFYEVRREAEHAHVICLTCRRVVELSGQVMADLRANLEQETGYSVQFLRMEVGGTCPACMGRTRAATKPGQA
jgi:Fur family ferric uptake transcriptional regulator